MIARPAISLAAGCASALMFASVSSGALVSLLLLYLASLPLMVAATGWGPLSAAIGGVTAALGVGVIFGPSYSLGYVITAALPAWWLGHLAMLGRPAEHGAGPTSHPLEWYPTGRILLWIAGFAVLITMTTFLSFTTDAEALAAAIRRGVIRVLAVQRLAADEAVIDAAAAIAPGVVVVGPMVMLMINLWLAARITAVSGRLHRPWPDLKTTALPSMTLVVLCVAAAFCFTGGLLAIMAKLTVGALLMAYAFTGLAVVHTLTLGLKSRAVWLGVIYVTAVMSVWLIAAMMVLGLADALFGLRHRYLRRRPPLPSPHS